MKERAARPPVLPTDQSFPGPLHGDEAGIPFRHLIPKLRLDRCMPKFSSPTCIGTVACALLKWSAVVPCVWRSQCRLAWPSREAFGSSGSCIASAQRPGGVVMVPQGDGAAQQSARQLPPLAKTLTSPRLGCRLWLRLLSDRRLD